MKGIEGFLKFGETLKSCWSSISLHSPQTLTLGADVEDC